MNLIKRVYKLFYLLFKKFLITKLADKPVGYRSIKSNIAVTDEELSGGYLDYLDWQKEQALDEHNYEH